MKRNLVLSLLAIIIVTLSSMAQAQFLKCDLFGPDSAAHNRFQIQAFIEVNPDANNQITAQISGTLTRAGIGSETVVLDNTTLKGSQRLYPAGTLGKEDVTLIQLSSSESEKVISLKAASGLKGPQSTLIIHSIPYRAECKLN